MREVFLVEGRDGRIVLFAPVQGLLMEIGKDEKEKIAALINRPRFVFRDLIGVLPEIEESRLLSRSAETGRTTERAEVFRPDVAVLFTTFDCSLRCVYCYANAGVQKANMDRQVATATVDFVIENAKAKGSKECGLEFHGGGEPTWNWSVFTDALSRFQERARAYDLTPKVGLATNGMLSEAQIGWLSERIRAVQVSLDGMEELQNFQRPTARGGRSFGAVCRAVESFLAKKIEVVIHTVVTAQGVSRIAEIVRFLAGRFPGVTAIHLEPAYRCGRGFLTGQQFPSPEFFVQGFIEAERIGESFGVEMLYSGSGPRLAELRRSFCGVTAPNFVVTPTGLVTACHEVAELQHPLAQCFIYGYLDRASNRFVFDEQKIERLRRYAAIVDPACQECFTRFYCAGDCLAKSLRSSGEKGVSSLNPRCTVNRELARHRLFKQLFNSQEGGRV